MSMERDDESMETLDLDAVLEGVSDELVEMLDAFTGQLLELAKAGNNILDKITEEMSRPGADEEVYKNLAGAVVNAISGFDFESEGDDGKKTYC